MTPRLRVPNAPLALLLLLGTSACGGAAQTKKSAEITPATLYPMPAGSAWSYDVDTGEDTQVLAIARVTEADAQHATVTGGEGATHYELRPDGIFRVERNAYLLKAPLREGADWPAGNGMHARIAHVGVTLQTTAGHFDNCVEVVEEGSPNGGVIETTYCPNVGPVQVVSSMQLSLAQQTVRVVAKLRGYSLGANP